MTGHGVARLAGAGLLVAVVACGGCAERPPSAPETASEGGVATSPEPPPVPTATPIPRELACEVATGCAHSPYPRPIARSADCYCPECPQPLGAAAAAEHEAAWNGFCGPGWADRAGCAAPMCRRPAALGCREGVCVSGPEAP